jgi:hypothetical protein
VTPAKMESRSASTLLGRGAGAGAGSVQEITLGSGLTMTGTTLSVSGGGGSSSIVGAKAFRASNQSIPNGSVWTTVNFNTETGGFDTNAFHDNSTNPSRFTVPSGQAGYYVIITSNFWEYSSGGIREARIIRNGSTSDVLDWDARGGPSDANITNRIVVEEYLNVGDYVELQVRQGGAGAINLYGTDSGIGIATKMTIRKVGN